MHYQSTKYCPDCLKFAENESQFMASFYELNIDNSYSGGISLYNILPDQNITESTFIEGPAIFDFYYVDELKALTANVDSTISFVDLSEPSNSSFIHLAKTVQKPLYLDKYDHNLFISMEGGYIGVLDLNKPSDIEAGLKEYQVHTDNTWMIKYHKEMNITLSGSDDTTLIMFDINQGSTINKLRPFKDDMTSGITSIELDQQDSNIIYVGCFGKQLKTFDLRNTKMHIASSMFDGGVWRIIQRENFLALALSYSNKYAVVDKKDLNTVFEFQGDHNSLLYGLDMKKVGDKYNLISCSFYDKKIGFNSFKVDK